MTPQSLSAVVQRDQNPLRDPAHGFHSSQAAGSIISCGTLSILTLECGVIAGTLDVMEIFNGRDAFRMKVQQAIEKELVSISRPPVSIA